MGDRTDALSRKMTIWIEASAPLRVDLAGGTLDLWPLYLLHPGASTVNVALQLRARARYEPASASTSTSNDSGQKWHLISEDRNVATTLTPAQVRSDSLESGDPFALTRAAIRHFGPVRPGTLTTRVDGPPGGGISGSSALMIALCGVLERLPGESRRATAAARSTSFATRRAHREQLVPLARDLECRVLGYPAGIQDYYPALFGGVQQLRYLPGRIERHRLDRVSAGGLGVRNPSDGIDRQQLQSRLLLAFGGRPHRSWPSNWSLFHRRIEGDSACQAGFDKISHAAARAAKALRNGGRRRFVDLAAAMRADWEARKQMDHRLAPNELLRLEKVGVEAGAWAAKGCGAAAGGCMLFLLKRATDRDRVQRALIAAGASMVPMTIAASGLRVRSG